ACALACVGGTTNCGGKCVDAQTDPANCGSCGAACKAGEVCAAGACALSCGGGTTKCGSKCVDAQIDPQNCGSCGKACAGGEVCLAGVCTLVCGGGTTNCGGKCVDTQTDPANCGSCGKACGGGETCVAGACKSACVPGSKTFNVTQTIEKLTIPVGCGSVNIKAAGGSGGENIALIGQNLAGKGALIAGDFKIAGGTELQIIVGKRGTDASQGNTANGAGGGGGGSFVRVTNSGTPLVVAGGGGGSCLTNNGPPHYYGKPGVTTNNGSGSRSHDQYNDAPGGTNGGEGWSGSGGRGWNLIWQDPAGKQSCNYGGHGGYGGGGGSGCQPNQCNPLHHAGGGGGYSGGGAGGTCYYFGGGGGGSYNAGSNPSNQEGANQGNGYVTLTWSQ
ncbi:MAG: hypothetical protein HY744_09670, partial [Deltaproteobacteria bacterium]|nr:hypothetical protein [Deltaproteobacteria bacterium]